MNTFDLNRNEIWAETEELADLIIRCPEIQTFHEAESQLHSHPKAVSMMAQLRDLQEQISDFQARRVPPKHFVHLLKESESLMEQLENIPEVTAFQQAQGEVNELLQSVTTRLAAAVLSKVDTRTNADGNA